ncbi:hypothetical protein MNBD_GAMMA12-2913 [hydrothermal vent metagenome]|uniref:Uncharacterized protein n=1 Tax=hydrothermal vent metagenome TaxID=652676 RepID=A0A3B0Z3E4_9ZZZZ
MSTLSNTVTFSIDFSKSIALCDIPKHRQNLSNQGVYLLLIGPRKIPVHLNKNIFYIGKAISETIYSRVQKHIYSIKDARTISGKQKTRPGKKFIAFRKRIRHKLDNLRIIPGYIDTQQIL